MNKGECHPFKALPQLSFSWNTLSALVYAFFKEGIKILERLRTIKLLENMDYGEMINKPSLFTSEKKKKKKKN